MGCKMQSGQQILAVLMKEGTFENRCWLLHSLLRVQQLNADDKKAGKVDPLSDNNGSERYEEMETHNLSQNGSWKAYVLCEKWCVTRTEGSR